MSTSETFLDTLKRMLTNRSSSTSLGSPRFLNISSVFSLPPRVPSLPVSQQSETVSKPDFSPAKHYKDTAKVVIISDDEEEPNTPPAKRTRLTTFLPTTAKKTCLEPRR